MRHRTAFAPDPQCQARAIPINGSASRHPPPPLPRCRSRLPTAERVCAPSSPAARPQLLRALQANSFSNAVTTPPRRQPRRTTIKSGSRLTALPREGWKRAPARGPEQPLHTGHRATRRWSGRATPPQRAGSPLLARRAPLAAADRRIARLPTPRPARRVRTIPLPSPASPLHREPEGRALPLVVTREQAPRVRPPFDLCDRVV